MRCTALSALLAAAAMFGTACAPHGLAHITLPSGPGAPAPEYATAYAPALSHCSDVRTFSAELSLSGHVGRQKVRGRVLAGMAPGALRLEALAPGGNPAFILVADGSRGRLLLASDRRVLDDAPPADILAALVGIGLGPDDVRALLSGCVQASPAAAGARAYGTEWIAVDLGGGDRTYLRRRADGTWYIAAGTHAGLTIQYVDSAGATPSRIRVTSPASAGHPDLDVTLGVSQVDLNGSLPRDQLVALTIPAGVSPITLQELRESYHR
jgi:hypothetical protein